MVARIAKAGSWYFQLPAFIPSDTIQAIS